MNPGPSTIYVLSKEVFKKKKLNLQEIQLYIQTQLFFYLSFFFFFSKICKFPEALLRKELENIINSDNEE